MSYSLKDVFYLGAIHEYDNATYNSGGVEGNIPIDISAYVDPIAKGRQRGQGLAVYNVMHSITGDSPNRPLSKTATGNFNFGLTVKPYATSGDGSTALESGDLTPESDLLIYGASYTAPASLAPGEGGRLNGEVYLMPSKEVPYVCVRDTIFQIIETQIATSVDVNIAYRLECAMISLDTATLNQLLRTQTA